MKKDLIKVAAILLALYVIQFFIAPVLFPRYYPSTNESTAILFGGIALFSFLGMVFVSDKLRWWLVCDAMYFLLMILFSNGGAYGIGMVGVPLDGNVMYYDRSVAYLLVAVIAAFTLVVQLLIWSAVKLTRIISARLRGAKKT